MHDKFIDDPSKDFEDTPVEETPEMVEPDGPTSEDPWSAFVSSLTDDEKGHLASILHGSPKADVRLDDSINAKAMDSIGDTVMEAGSVIEDYRSELEKVILMEDGPMKRVTATDSQYRMFETTLTNPDREYIIKLTSGKHMMGRKPERRILSINCKAVLNIGSNLIINGKIVPEHLKWAKTLKNRN